MLTNTIPLGVNPKNMLQYTVLVVDDSKLDRAHLKRILSHKQFKLVGEFVDGIPVMDTLEKMAFVPDILFLDYDMPGMNGLEVLKKVRPVYPNMKIIMCTSHTEKELIHELIKLKISGFILKPFSEQKILDKVAPILGRKDLLPKEIVVVTKKIDVNLNEINIPSVPTVVMKVMTFDTDNPQGGSAELEKIISPDKAISANIIRIANSAYYGRSGKIQTLKDAITLLGMKMVRNLVFLQAKKTLNSSLKGETFKKFLQELPILTALIAFDMANPLKLKRQQGEQFFLSALLRKIGMTVLALTFTKKYLSILQIFELGEKGLFTVEKEGFNITSIQMGLIVFQTWKMPESFLDVIKNQDFKQEDVDKVNDVDRVTRLAEIFALKMLNINPKEGEEELANAILAKYEIEPEDFGEIFGEDYYEMIQDHPLYDMAVH